MPTPKLYIDPQKLRGKRLEAVLSRKALGYAADVSARWIAELEGEVPQSVRPETAHALAAAINAAGVQCSPRDITVVGTAEEVAS